MERLVLPEFRASKTEQLIVAPTVSSPADFPCEISKIIDELKTIDTRDIALCRAFLEQVLKSSLNKSGGTNALVASIITVWISEHIITLNLNKELLPLRQLASSKALALSEGPNILIYSTRAQLVSRLEKILNENAN